ncbi:MAG: PQQ-dependent sugar dehydrogenase [Alphaproteobacteria bacterium]|nr:PQQ-dependent sugar dehydrogenase [Alphaproteobacteria bacterium]
MKKFAASMLLAGLLGSAAYAQVNMGDQKPAPDLAFNVTKVVDFDTQPWRIAFLPDGRMLVTEKNGHLWLITQQGQKTEISGAPTVLYGGQGGFLGVYLSPHYATDHNIYLTYSEPHVEGDAPPASAAATPPPAPAAAAGRGAPPGGRGAPPAGRGGGGRGAPTCPGDAAHVCGSSLALARARLDLGTSPSLQGLQVIWRDPAGGQGGQFGAAVAFSPDKKYLFLSSGDRQRMTPAQDPNSPLGKVLRLTLDGKPAPGNPGAGKPSAQTLNIINPPADTEVAKTAPVVRTFTYPASAPNQTVAETWSMGHRTPYGLAFAPNGQLWELEHGPRGGDKLNLIVKGKNYGWPLAGYAPNYNGVIVPSFDFQPNLTKPVIFWNPVIAPGSLTFYKGKMFKGWSGSALAGGMGSNSLTRITFDGKGGAKAVERWDMKMPIRDTAVAPDGAIWVAEGGLNASLKGALFRLTPK